MDNYERDYYEEPVECTCTYNEQVCDDCRLRETEQVAPPGGGMSTVDKTIVLWGTGKTIFNK